MKQEREIFKRLNSAYYHPNEKLWSVENLKDTFNELAKMFRGKYEIKKKQSHGEISGLTVENPIVDNNSKSNGKLKPDNETFNKNSLPNENSLQKNADTLNINHNSQSSQSEQKGQQYNLPTFLTANQVKITSTNRQIFIFLRKNEIDIQFIRSITYSRWDKTKLGWVVPNFGENLNHLKRYFGYRLIEHNEIKSELICINKKEYNRAKNELLVIRNANNRLQVTIEYNKDLVRKLKQFPFLKYDKSIKIWSFPYNEKYIHDLKNIAISEK